MNHSCASTSTTGSRWLSIVRYSSYCCCCCCIDNTPFPGRPSYLPFDFSPEASRCAAPPPIQRHAPTLDIRWKCANELLSSCKSFVVRYHCLICTEPREHRCCDRNYVRVNKHQHRCISSAPRSPTCSHSTFSVFPHFVIIEPGKWFSESMLDWHTPIDSRPKPNDNIPTQQRAETMLTESGGLNCALDIYCWHRCAFHILFWLRICCAESPIRARNTTGTSCSATMTITVFCTC